MSDLAGELAYVKLGIAAQRPREEGEVPIRIYALAKELAIDSKELVEVCNKAGVTGKGSALASLSDDEEEKIKAHLSKTSTPNDSSAALCSASFFSSTGFPPR